jgi:hypothetical protein
LPDASGTLALTSNLSSYLPLTGGTLSGVLTSTVTSSYFLSAVSATTSEIFARIGNTASFMSIGCESSVGGIIVTNSSPYAAVFSQFYNKPIQLATNNVVVQTITGSGNVLIGSTTDDTVNKLQVTGSGKFTTNLNIGTTLGIGINSDSVVGLFLQSTGTTSATYATIMRNSAATNIFVIRDNGEVTISNLAGTGSRTVLASATGVLSAPISDISVKQNIEPLKYGLDTILQLNAIQFEFIEGYKNYGEGLQIGTIAQEVEQIIPEAVFTTPSTGLKGINYDQFNGIYIKAIQDQQKIIESLLKRIEALENK